VHESARLATSRSKGGMADHVGALPNKTHSSYRTSLVALDDDFPDSPLGKLIVGASLSSRPFRPDSWKYCQFGWLNLSTEATPPSRWKRYRG